MYPILLVTHRACPLLDVKDTRVKYEEDSAPKGVLAENGGEQTSRLWVGERQHRLR